MSWRRTYTRRQLLYRGRRQAAWLRAHPEALSWEPLDRAPWWGLGGLQPPANLAFADLSSADLGGICLERANLRGVLCPARDLSGLCMRGALLRDAIVARCRFEGTDLSQAQLQGADLSHCDLRNTALDGASFGQTKLTSARVDWSRVGPGRWLVCCEDGVAHGGFGELEQDFVYKVIDQKSGCIVARYESSLYQSYMGSSPPVISGPQRVEITADALYIRLIEEERETLHPLPR